MGARKDIKKILLIGSGPIVIGQACEFDYSGSQAVKALKEEGYEVILVNPNPATVMTTPGIADRIYMEPLKVESVREIIRQERPDALLSTMGGQTALNLSIALSKAGVLEEFGVEIIGADIESIRIAEDRGLFKQAMSKIGLESPASAVVHCFEEAKAFADKNGFPLVIRPSFTLGGMGGSIAADGSELRSKIERALLESPSQEALVEESLIGWKEFELEVMRDKADNAIIVCSIENVDPMGVHTGDSITVAPIQTLSDREYQKMRTAAIEVLRAVGIDCGGSNVQFAMHPHNGRMLVIEMNPRVSRSSALASKATGFPIARASAKLAVGFTLDEILNEITGKTVSCFEPALDYTAVKVPRFEMDKFPTGYSSLGTQMKSVGESLAIGRTFTEALNKAIRAAEIGYDGLEELRLKTVNAKEAADSLEQILTQAHPLRIFALYTALRKKGPQYLKELSSKTGFDPWFLHHILCQIQIEDKIAASPSDPALLLEAKRHGLSDKKIASLGRVTESFIEKQREKLGIHATFHFVDTCAGEFDAFTPYFYSSWGEQDEGGQIQGNAVIILASGPNRIGQGLEFDTSCTLASLAYKKLNIHPILVNSNPETVSTDFNVSDRLYMEPLTVEHVKEIIRKEKVKDILVQLGGQTPLNMAKELHDWGVRIIGTSIESIMAAEDRGLFAKLLRKLGLRQPENRMAQNPEEVVRCAEEIGYPVLLRPSFVLGGKHMFIAFNKEELSEFLKKGIRIDADTPVLVDQFLEDAFEYDLDALCDTQNVYIAGIMEHIEAAGIHSGDSACVFPVIMAEQRIIREMIDATVKISREIKVCGFINIQFAVKDNCLYVLEVNPRSSRTVPFLSKASGINLVESAVRIWCGQDLKTQGLTDAKGIGIGACILGWAIKEAVFSFERFSNVDPILGPEMKSTGEGIGIGQSFGEAYAKAQATTGAQLPVKGKAFVSVNQYDRQAVLPMVQELVNMGFEIAATRGTANFLFENGIFSEVILKIHEGRPNVIDHMRSGKINLLINTPLGRFSQKGDHDIRIEAVQRKIPYTTTTSAAKAAIEGIRYLRQGKVEARPLYSEYKELNKKGS